MNADQIHALYALYVVGVFVMFGIIIVSKIGTYNSPSNTTIVEGVIGGLLWPLWFPFYLGLVIVRLVVSTL